MGKSKRHMKGRRNIRIWLTTFVLLSAALVGGFGTIPFASAAEKVVLEFPSWYFGMAPFDEYLHKVIDEFEEKYPNIEVNGYDLPFTEYIDKMTARFGAGNPPDLMMIPSSPNDYNKYVDLGLLEPLGKRMDKTDFKETYAPLQTSAPILVDGEVYMLVTDLEVYVPIYHTNIYEKAGVGIPGTKDEFLQAIGKLTQDINGDGLVDQYGYAAMVRPGNFQEMYMDLAIWVISAGGTHFAKDGRPTVNDPGVIEALETVKQIFDNAWIPKGMDKSQYRRMFSEATVATLIDGPYMYGVVEAENPQVISNYSAYPLPFGTGRAGGAFEGVAIPVDAEHKEEAWKFLEVLGGQFGARTQLEMTFIQPARMDVYTDAFLNKHPWLRVFREAGNNVFDLMPPGLETDAIKFARIVGSHMEEVLFMNKPVGQAMEEAQSELIEALER